MNDELDYSDPETLRNEVEGYISAGATDAEIIREIPLNVPRLLGVIRVLLAEQAAARQGGRK